MTDLTVALRLLADTAGAEGGLKKLAASLREMGAEQRRAGAEGDAAADRTADAWVQAAARIEAAAAAGPDAMGRNAQAASGQMGNLVAQFNDIAVMLQAGQNPLQLAMQQGMQITQVIGPMGAAGAVKALGSAFLGMLSPINLVTIGGLAAGAALFQWLTSGTEKALTLDEAMGDLEDQLGTYDKAAKAAAASTAEMREQFGDAADEARVLLREVAQMEAGAAARALAGASDALRSEHGLVRNDGRTDTGALANMFDLSRFGRGREQRQALIVAVSQGFADIDTAAGVEDESARIDAMAAAVRQLRDAFAAAADASGDRSDEEQAILRVLNDQVLAAARLKTAKDAAAKADREEIRAGEDRTTRARPEVDWLEVNASTQRRAGLEAEARLGAVIAQHGRDSLEAARARVLAERDAYQQKLLAANLTQPVRDAEMAAWDAAKGIPALERDRLATAKALLADLQQQVTVQQAVATFGENSAEAARARTDAERSAFAALVDSLVPAGDLRDQLMAAWEQAEGLARADMASGIAAARAEAAGLAAQLGVALDTAVQIRAMNALEAAKVEFSPGGQAMAAYGSRAPGGTATQQAIATRNAPKKDPKSAGGAGAGAGGALSGLTGEAQKLLAELGIAQATVAEKVRAGLQSVAEGETEMANAKTRTAERLANLIARLEALGPAGQAAAEQARAALAGLGSEAESVGAQVQASFIDSFEDSLARSLATGKNAMTGFADHVKMELARAFTQKFITPLVSPLINGVMGLFGGLFPSAQGNVFQAGRAVPFAMGGVPDLSAHRDTVVNRPTVFPMAGGQTGLMGEAGPEAILPLLSGIMGLGVRAMRPDGTADILPLRRAPGGALGVALPEVPDVGAVLRRPTFLAQGGVVGRLSDAPRMGEAAGAIGGGRHPPMQVNIVNNNPNARVEATERQGGDGMSMEIVIEQIEGALADRARRGVGSLSGVLGAEFGLSRQGR